jgi:AcrR family transcriptional regulator
MSTANRQPTRRYRGATAAERAAERRERLLAAGLECFGSRGVDGTRVKDVCRAAGLTDRYFYESFADTRALFVAVFDRVTDELFAAVGEAVLAVEPRAEPQLRAAIGTFLHALDDDPRRARVVFSEAAVAGAEAERHMRATLRRFAALVAATARAHLPAAVGDDLVDLVGLSLVGTLERVVVDWQEGHLDAPLDEVVDRVVVLELATLRGLAGRA